MKWWDLVVFGVFSCETVATFHCNVNSDILQGITMERFCMVVANPNINSRRLERHISNIQPMQNTVLVYIPHLFDNTDSLLLFIKEVVDLGKDFFL